MTQADHGAEAYAGRFIEICMNFWASQLVLVAAEMGLADDFGDGPQDADALAARLGLHAPSFRRYLRALGGLGLVTETGPGQYALTGMGAALKSGAPGGARSTIRIMAGTTREAWSEFNYSLRTGNPAFEHTNGMGLFEFIAKNPGMAEMFSESMVGIHGPETRAVAEAYDFSGIGTLVDVGGASGNMLAHILSRHPELRGVLFDLPHVVADAPALLDQYGVAERVFIESGSFFERVPAGHDAYLMSHIIHDWDDQEIATILGHCRDAMKPDGRLLIVEMVLPEGDVFHPGKLLDMVMLAVPGGQERTPSEYDAMLKANGFKLKQIVPTASAVSIVEAVRA